MLAKSVTLNIRCVIFCTVTLTEICTYSRFILYSSYLRAGIAVDIATLYGLQGPGSDPNGDKIFRIRPDRPQDAPSPLYNEHRVCFQGVELPERGVDHPPPICAEINLQEPCVLYIGRAYHYPLDAPFYIYSTNIRTEYFKHAV